MSQLQGAGGQPQKQPKYAPLYTGRIFNGLYTNRSPLRGSLPSMYEQFYRLSYGDVMIAGSNVEVSNRLTLVRRPGNPIFDSNSWTDIQAFDEFRVNKAASDAFGTVLEEIFTMVSEPGALYATLNGAKQFVFGDSAVPGQFYMQSIGNELYFSNGVDNKKWLQSLIFWAANFKFQGTNGLAGTYPFFSTYMLTGATSATDPGEPFGAAFGHVSPQQIQQLIGIAAGKISNVAVSSNVLTLTIDMTLGGFLPDTVSYPIDPNTKLGPSFMIWGVDTETWLNGLIVTATSAYVAGAGTWTFTAVVNHANYTSAADTGYLQQIGTTPIVAQTGSTVPAWQAYVANTDNHWGSTAPTGNIILDGNVLWVNRGSSVENWGIQAPTTAVTTTETGSSTVGWKANTYYSSPGIVVDANNNIWQVTTPGVTGTTNPFPVSPIVGQTQADGSVVWTVVTIHTAGGNAWASHASFIEGKYEGAYPWTAMTTPADGSFLPDWVSGHFIIANAAGTPCVFELQKNIPANNINVPLSATYGGGAVHQTSAPYTAQAEGWTCAFFNHSGPNNQGYNSPGTVDIDWGGSIGNPVLFGTATPAVPTASATGVSSVMWNYYNNGGTANVTHPMKDNTVNFSGETADGTFTIPWAGQPADTYEFCQWGQIRIPVAGMDVTFQIGAYDAAWFGVESTAGATLTSFSITDRNNHGVLPNLMNMFGRTLTPWNGYPILAGVNLPQDGNLMTVVINFPNAGVFGVEFVYGKSPNTALSDGRQCLIVGANGSLITPEQSETTPFFQTSTNSPSFGSAGWNLLSAAQNTYPSTLEIQNNVGIANGPITLTLQGNQLRWFNLGPVTDFTWHANTPITPPSTIVIDTNSNEERAYETGISGTATPTWQTALYSITADKPNLNWINEGSIPPLNNTPGLITATTVQGWKYWIALVNTLDNTVSNVSPASVGTGPVIAGQIKIAAGSGIDLTTLDPQTDYVAIFRSTDGGAIPLLINGLGNSFWTVPLTQYLQEGYVDSTPDADLNELIQGATAGENTPPLPGIGTITFHLSRGWYAIGNTVYYTSGPNAPSGNGNGTNPLNVDTLPSRVVRLVPTAIGMLVFTISDIYIIAGNGTANNPILPAIPYLTGVGLANYNALDINGSIIGFFTTDKQFVIFNPSAGVDYVGNPIGDQFRKDNGLPGTSWDTSLVQVSWYTNGEDQAWFVGDGQFGWYKLIATPSPETGNCWSPFATIASGGISAMRAIETSPGVHSLLLGPSGTGSILARSLDATTDGGSTGSNGTAYPAYGVFGSYVFALPGQVAKIAFVTTTSVRVGSPLVIGLLLDEALPYYKGSFDVIKRWVTDPPEIPESKSFYNQRFYLAEDPDQTAYCSNMQLMVQFPAEAAASELQSFSVFGAFEVEI